VRNPPEHGDPPLRVLGWPAFRTKDGNPYNWLLYSHMVAQGVDVDEYCFGSLVRGKYDILHLHWPEWQISHPDLPIALLRYLRLMVILRVARRKGIRIAWTVHNLRCHEDFHPRLGARFYDTFIPFVDGYLSLSKAHLAKIRELYPGLASRPCTVTLLGHFRGVYPDDVPAEAGRARLGIGKGNRVILHFGSIRPYKNVTALIREFRKTEGREFVLLIAGHPMNPALEAEIRDASSGDPRIRLHLRFVGNEDVQFYFKAADLVVLPFRENWNSASALLALSFHRPVLVPALPSILELQGIVGGDWIRTYDGAFTADALSGGIEWAMRPGRPSVVPLASIGWDAIASGTKEFFRKLRTAGRDVR
jgi:glycosyltransferase involved in cell wall biosynthesis